MEWISLREEIPKPNELVLWYDAMFENIMYFALEDPSSHDGDFTHFMRIEHPEMYKGTAKKKALDFYITTNEFFASVDYPLLRKQYNAVISAKIKKETTAEEDDLLEGLLNFIDEFRDCAKKNHILNDNTVGED